MSSLENKFIILKVNTRVCKTRDVLLRIKSKTELVDALVRKEVTYYRVGNMKYTAFISDMEKNPFIRGHIKHINIFNLYS